ncbi:MAG: AAA family ATPase [Bacteroidetes bacterium RIFCSPLOWO2_02_FULL_36_8]|nr:MAG: AAA family ATPase [Bacteroidetes bacterium RIFCSPLOWO2_02_FULL_36_8]OFY69540.1 MAG: AAA family ATPase [Bacteroidetes bacterium RIFCSPLOWO2_12_FULL_37_12]
MNITRIIENSICDKLLKSNKVVILYGARQVGKTTLSNSIMDKLKMKTLSINADQIKYADILSSRDIDKIKGLVDGYELLFIDEAQRIPDIGINLKIITDELKLLKLLVTGSSSFELSNNVSEPLTGRSWTFKLFPVAVCELASFQTPFELKNKVSELMVYGSYPEILTTINTQEKQKLLEEIGLSYLYKDVFQISTIKYQRKVQELLKLLSFQIGQEVSINELSNTLSISRETVERYLDLLEKSFVIFRLTGFSNNLRREVKKTIKFYFYDLGIRNLLIDNFKPLEHRNDTGHLWENFIIAERMKFLSCTGKRYSSYFWRLQTGAEIDYIEEYDGGLFGYEIKYSKTVERPPASWSMAYKNSQFQCVNKENFLEFVSSKPQ